MTEYERMVPLFYLQGVEGALPDALGESIVAFVRLGPSPDKVLDAPIAMSRQTAESLLSALRHALDAAAAATATTQ